MRRVLTILQTRIGVHREEIFGEERLIFEDNEYLENDGSGKFIRYVISTSESMRYTPRYGNGWKELPMPNTLRRALLLHALEDHSDLVARLWQ